MPFTPYHFGPGALIKSVIPRHFSFLIFFAVQVLIDCETLYYMLTHQTPLHRLLHTYLGCHLVILAAICVLRPIYNFFFDGELEFLPTVIAAFIGAYSHVFLDSIMHVDMKPWAPYSYDNKMWHIIDVQHLHLLSLYCGAVGLGILVLRSFLKR